MLAPVPYIDPGDPAFWSIQASMPSSQLTVGARINDDVPNTMIPQPKPLPPQTRTSRRRPIEETHADNKRGVGPRRASICA